MNSSRLIRRVRGVSLIEALVALAVMAVGLLGVVGMQASLRFNADVSRQRAEAVRMAQEKMEELRAFGVLSGAVAGEHDYTKIITGTDIPSVPFGFGNTIFSRTVTVPATVADDPRYKVVQVNVSWLDRRTAAGGIPESVTLTSSVAQVAPVLGASLGLPGDRAGPQRPHGRHPAIPRGAVTQPGGTSIFEPAGSGGPRFTFNSSTGRIVEFCLVPSSCNTIASALLSGYVHFATAPPLAALDPQALLSAEAETPSGTPPTGLGVAVVLTQPDTITVTCVTAAAISGALPYYCAVPLVPAAALTTTYAWSGQSVLTGLTNLSATLSNATATNLKVCRYTPDASTDRPQTGNAAHPLDYTAVGQSLSNQNFLVIPAGNGSIAYSCPTDLGTTPLVDGDTRRHQPTAT